MQNNQSTASRRTFIQSTTAGAAGATLINQALFSTAAFAEGKEQPLKVALIGCGGRGTGAIAQALNTEGTVTLWAMADAFEDRLQSSLSSLRKGLKSRYDREQSEPLEPQIDVPAERQFIGLDAYKKAIDSGVDVVIITGPPGFRPVHFEYAIQQNKHVFMEKPVAADPIGVRRVLAAAKVSKRKNLKVGVGLQRRHKEAYLQAMQKIHAGEVGRIVAMRCYWNTGFPAKTPYDRERSISELQHQIRNWYFFDWLSGDHICEQHIHNLDVCNWAKGEHPVEAEGMGGRQVRVGKEYGNIFDHHAVIYTYPDGTQMHSYCRQIPGCSKEVTEYVECEKGLVSMANGTGSSVKHNGETLWQTPRRSKDNPYQTEHDRLFAAIRNDREHNEAEYGATSTMTAILGRLATYSGKVVTWDEAIASEFRTVPDYEDWQSAAPIQPLADGSYTIATPGISDVL